MWDARRECIRVEPSLSCRRSIAELEEPKAPFLLSCCGLAMNVLPFYGPIPKRAIHLHYGVAALLLISMRADSKYAALRFGR